jgi:two-component system chemotaxis response regulator CheY
MLSIMIVDDEDILHVLYGKLLEHKGHRVVGSAYNGEDAVRLYSEMDPRPDLVLMDHRMPIRNGLEALGDIMAIDGDAKIVFLTADAGVAEQAMEMGATDVLLKPFRMDVLHRTVEKVAAQGADRTTPT